MKTLASVTFICVLVFGLCIAIIGISQTALPSKTEGADSVYLGGYVSRFDDTERGVTCYMTGPSGIDCLPTIKN